MGKRRKKKVKQNKKRVSKNPDPQRPEEEQNVPKPPIPDEDYEELVDKKIEETKKDYRNILIGVEAILISIILTIIIACKWKTSSCSEAALEIAATIFIAAIILTIKYVSSSKIDEERKSLISREALIAYYIREKNCCGYRNRQLEGYEKEIDVHKQELRKSYKKVRRIIRACYIWYAILLTIFSGAMIPVAYAGTAIVKDKIDQRTMLRNIKDETPVVTITPKPEKTYEKNDDNSFPENNEEVDQSQENFTALWNQYFASFKKEDVKSLEEVKQLAGTVIKENWLGTKTKKSVFDWDWTEMDIYEWDVYEKSKDQESKLKDTHTESDILEKLLQAGTGYVDTASLHISSEHEMTERDLGLSSLRGVQLLLEYIQRDGGKGLQIGYSWNSIACLLRQCADSLYEGTGEKSFILYTFAYECYILANENGYQNYEFVDMEIEMSNTFDSWCSSERSE